MGISNEMSPADIRACTENNCSNGYGGGMGWGGDWSWWIILFLIFGLFGGNWGGGFGGGGITAGTNVLSSDFAMVDRKLDGIANGICDATFSLNNTITNGFAAAQNTMTQGFAGLNTGMITQGYETRNAINGVGTQLSNCCCDLRSDIAGVNYNNAINTNTLSREVERGFCDTNYNAQNQHFQTMNAIDKVGDRIIDWMAQRDAQNLRDENQALRLAASQANQNNYLISQLKTPCPVPAYLTCNPNAPLNYNVTYGNNGGCGCGGNF